MKKIILKKGDTLALSCQLKDADGLPIDLTTYTISSQVRRPSGLTLVDTLTVTITDAAAGEYSIYSSATSAWPVDLLLCDIKYAAGASSVIRTETFVIDLREAITA